MQGLCYSQLAVQLAEVGTMICAATPATAAAAAAAAAANDPTALLHPSSSLLGRLSARCPPQPSHLARCLRPARRALRLGPAGPAAAPAAAARSLPPRAVVPCASAPRAPHLGDLLHASAVAAAVAARCR